MSHALVRTQIYLPKKLKDEIERQSKRGGESMAEFIRNAVKKKVKDDIRRKDSLKNFAKRIFGKPVKNSGWGKVDSYKWVRDFRRREDEYMIQKLKESRPK